MRKILLLLCVVGLAVAGPAQAEGGKQVHVRGVVVSASAEVVVVENTVGDAVFRCLVPERLAEKAAALKAGDRVRMLCLRKRGQRAVLLKLERAGDRAEKRDHEEDEHEDEGEENHEKGERRDGEKRPDHAAPAAARGVVVELAATGIVVQDAESGRRLACRVPEERKHKLDGLKVGDRVKILCANGQLAHLERAAAEELKLVGTISALSSASVTVSGDGRSLTCAVPAAFAEKIGRFAVGMRVKMLCRGTELAYLAPA